MSDDPILPAGPSAADESEERFLDEHYPASRERPAIFVNNFYVTSSSGIIRIAFGESAEEPVGTKYRVTVALPMEDAKDLARIVAKMIAEIEEEATPAKKEAR